VLLVFLATATGACSSAASATPGSGEASQAATASLAPAESGSSEPSVAASQASSSHGSTGSSGAPSSAGAAASPSAIAASPGASGPLTLAANICDMLDQVTITRISGINVGPGQPAPVDKKTYLSGCNWLEGQSAGFQLSSQTEAKIRSEIAHPPSGYKRVNGVGVAARVKTATLFYTDIKEVSLIVDEGSFGLVFGLTGPKATVAQDVALAKAVQ
jgi:hypothetical protein